MQIAFIVLSEFLFVLERSTASATLETSHLLRFPAAGVRNQLDAGSSLRHGRRIRRCWIVAPALYQASLLHAAVG